MLCLLHFTRTGYTSWLQEWELGTPMPQKLSSQLPFVLRTGALVIRDALPFLRKEAWNDPRCIPLPSLLPSLNTSTFLLLLSPPAAVYLLKTERRESFPVRQVAHWSSSSAFIAGNGNYSAISHSSELQYVLVSNQGHGCRFPVFPLSSKHQEFLEFLRDLSSGKPRFMTYMQKRTPELAIVRQN